MKIAHNCKKQGRVPWVTAKGPEQRVFDEGFHQTLLQSQSEVCRFACIYLLSSVNMLKEFFRLVSAIFG